MINGTQTTHGFIEYYRHNGIDLPVKVKITNKVAVRTLLTIRPPVTKDDMYVFVLPGGGDFISDREAV